MTTFAFSKHRRYLTANTTNMVLRFAISVTFILSGISKGANIEGTSQLIIQYLGLLDFNVELGMPSNIIAAIICSFEIFVGMLALNRKTFVLILPICTFAILAFTILTFINLVSPLVGLESCGCFGELIHLNAKETFYKNIVLLLLSFYLICKQRRLILSSYRHIVKHGTNGGSIFVLIALVAIFPICISSIMDNGLFTRTLTLYYLSCVVSLFIAACVLLRGKQIGHTRQTKEIEANI